MFRPLLFFAVLIFGVHLFPPSAQGNGRPPANDEELHYWISNMLAHRFQLGEMRQATGLPFPQLVQAIQRVDRTALDRPADQLLVLPYPGGRHPRIGFLDGAIDPQRESKISVFAPWDAGSYVVVDMPEAIWSNLGLTYLAHTHIDTVWTKQGVQLETKEWERLPNGVLKMHRVLPNGIQFGTLVFPARHHVSMAMWMHNGTSQSLSDLRVQNCVMLKKAEGFNALSNDNKILESPFVACHSEKKTDRWIITAWEPCHRPWANPPVPCLHSDPKFPDLAPGESAILNGWLSFHDQMPLEEAISSIRAAWKPLGLDDIAEAFTSPESKQP